MLYYSLLKLNNEEKTLNTIDILVKLLVDEASNDIMVIPIYNQYSDKTANI